MTSYGKNKVINYLKELHDGDIEFLNTEEHYCKRRGMLDILLYLVDGIIHRREIERSHYLDIVLELNEEA